MLTRAFFAACVILGACGGTTSTPGTGPSTTEASYTAEMEAVCATAEAELDSLPDPPDEITVSAFAVEVARIVQNEADAVRTIDPPDDLSEEHRAFIANTDDQARSWLALADVAETLPEEIGDRRTEIAELILGRDDLATEMGLPACRRDE
jgi:hypothetical protein